MDENENGNVNSRNWTFHQFPRTPYEEPHHHHNHMPLNLMPSMIETSLSGGGGGGGGGGVRELPVTASTNHHHHHHITGISGGPLNPLSCWMGPNSSKYLNNPLSVNPNRPYYLQSYVDVSSEASSPQITLPKNDTSLMINKVEESCEERDNSGGGGSGGGVAVKKRGGGGGGKAPKEKKPRTNKTPRGALNEDRAKAPKKMAEVVINGQNMDISKIPIPICSCTGTAHQCYRWGSGGWQSACCTTGLSVHPLPVSTKRRGARIAGRKMSVGAFKKVLEKLSSEGYDFSNPIDLRSYWAKHGTNKFVTIRDGPG